MAGGKSNFNSDFNPDDLELYKVVINNVAELRLASVKQYEAVFRAVIKTLGDSELKSAETIYEQKRRLESDFLAEKTKNGRQLTNAEINEYTRYQAERKAAEDAYYAQRQKHAKQVLDITDKYEQEKLKRMTAREVYEHKRAEVEKSKNKRKQLQEDEKLLSAQLATYEERIKTATGEEQSRLAEAIDIAKRDIAETQQLIKSASDRESSARAEVQRLTPIASTSEDRIKDHQERLGEIDTEKFNIAAEAMAKIAEIENSTETTKDERAKQIKDVENEAKRKQKELEKEASKERAAIDKEEQDQKNKDNWSAEGLEKTMKDNLSKMADKIGSAISSGLNQITDNVNSFYQYQAKVEARLQGSEASYKDSLKTITKNVGFSGYIKQKDVINNLVKLVETGVSYNVDLRAFLATISDKVASTFDVFDSNLLRIIRIQQADTTAARLGMEASLTRLFNEYFSDTSYLSDAFDNVAAALQDASALKSHHDALSFEYIAQKWLGSLYSLGLSDNAANTIAQGLGYIGSGNVDALNNNDSLQTLMAMSAAHGGLSYADLLTGGLTTENTNKLLKGMVTYLKTIAENTDSSVVTKSAYANLFGMSTTDLRSIQNLTDSDIANIYAENLSYSGALSELQNQTSQIANRTHISQVLSNVFDNALMSNATTLGNSSGIWGTWMTLNLIEDLTGGINIPAISVMGNAVDLQTTVTALAKGGIAGLGLMGSLISALASGGGLGASYDLQSWGFDQYTSRGGGYTGISRGVNSGFSASETIGEYTGSASSDDMKSNTLAEGASSAEEDSKITNASTEDNADIYQKIYNAIADDSNSVISRINELHNHIVVDKEAINVNVDLGESGAMQVSLAGMSDPVKDFYNTLAESIVNGLFSGGDSDVGTETEGTNPMQEAFAKALQSSLNVYITNSYFDNLCQKFGLGGV